MKRFFRPQFILAMSFLITLGLSGGALAAKVKVGDKAPDFKLPATNGKDISLSDYRGKKMVLIEFYHADFGPT